MIKGCRREGPGVTEEDVMRMRRTDTPLGDGQFVGVRKVVDLEPGMLVVSLFGHRVRPNWRTEELRSPEYEREFQPLIAQGPIRIRHYDFGPRTAVWHLDCRTLDDRRWKYRVAGWHVAIGVEADAAWAEAVLAGDESYWRAYWNRHCRLALGRVAAAQALATLQAA